MRTTSPDYKSLIPVEADAYRADMDIADRYQQSVQEILRLALLGIAGFGFLLGKIVFSIKGNDGGLLYFDAFLDARWAIILGSVFFALSAGAALLHKHYTTECLNHHVRSIRLNTWIVEQPNDPGIKKVVKKIRGEEKSLRRDLDICHWLYVTASMSLWLGVVVIVVVFTIVLT